MNKRYFAEVNKFKGKQDCYIHIEMKNGGKCERLFAGGYLAIIHGLAGGISRLAELSGQTPLAVLYDLEEWIKKAEGLNETDSNNQ